MKLAGWKKVNKGSLRGFIALELAVENSRPLTIYECPVHVNEHGPWVALPAKGQIDRDGNLRRNDRGKIEYVRVLMWGGEDTGDRFSRAAIQLLLAQYPDALGREGDPP